MKNLYKRSIATVLLSLIVITCFSQSTNAFRFSLNGNGYSDQAIIRLVNGATVNFDGSYDAWKLFSSNPNVPSIYTQIVAGQELSINSLPEFTEDKSITIYTNIPVNGTYTLDFEEVYALTSNYKISITDISSTTHYRLLGDTALTFYCNTQQNSPSFTFNISTPIVSSQTNETCFGVNDGVLTVNNAGNNDWDIEIIDPNGNHMNNTSNSSAHSYSNLIPGSYSSTISSKGIEENFNFVITPADHLTANFNLNKDTVYLSDGGVVSTINSSQFAQNYFWDFDDAGISSATNPSHTYTALGNYTITLLSSNLNCTEQTSKQVVVLSSPSLSTSMDNYDNDNLQILSLGNGNFKLNMAENGSKKIAVYDLTGKIVFEAISTENNYAFTLSNKAQGIFILNLILDTKTSIQKKIYNN